MAVAAETLKYGIIGVGMMGREHLLNLHHLRNEGVSVVAIADPHVPSQQLALDLAQSFNWPIKVNNWNWFNLNSGGTLVEKCCHFFDLMRLFAAANPIRVMASGGVDVNHKDEMYDGKVPDIIDNAYVIVEFDNGTRGMLDLCMFAEGSKNEQEISVVGEIGKGEAFVPENVVRFGTRLAGRNGVETVKVEDGRIKYDGLHHGSSYLEHLNFFTAIRAKGEIAPAVDLQDGLISVAMGVAAQLSIEKSRFVTIDEVVN